MASNLKNFNEEIIPSNKTAIACRANNILSSMCYTGTAPGHHWCFMMANGLLYRIEMAELTCASFA